MEVFKKIKDLQARLNDLRNMGKTIGFTPTMGALHQGHISLVERSNNENDISVVSIFVNPTQFNNKEDLEKYPRNLEADFSLLEKNNCDIVFAPEVAEMYPQEDTRVFELGKVTQVMEGKYRPGHFNGVCQVVSHLFEIVEADRAYFGQKDYQQIAVIRAMKDKYMPNLKTQIISCPIKRKESGLALSSRNMRLSQNEKQSALLISKCLFEAKNMYDNGASLDTLIDFINNYIKQDSTLEMEYVEIADKDTLETITEQKFANAVICITVYCNKVRLIDNILL